MDHSLLPNGTFPHGADAGSWAMCHRALEGMLRVAALMPSCVPVGQGAPIDGTLDSRKDTHATEHRVFGLKCIHTRSGARC